MPAAARAIDFESQLRSLWADPDTAQGGGTAKERAKIGRKFNRTSSAAGKKYTGGSSYDPKTGVFYDAQTDTYHYTYGGESTVGYNRLTGGGPGGGVGGVTDPTTPGTAVGTPPTSPGGTPTTPGGTEPPPGGTTPPVNPADTAGMPTADLTDPEVSEYFTRIFGPDSKDIMDAIIQGLPSGLKIKGIKELEIVYPMVRDAYNRYMQNLGIGTGYAYLDQLREDPLLKGASGMMSSILENPYTFDDETVGLMKGATADMLANQEAAMGERLRSMGATQGISPDSPAYASLASQQAMIRDINLAKMQRELDVKIAQQRQQDRYSAVTGAGEFGGAYQTLLGQGFGQLANLQAGGGALPMTNPFAGLWQGTLGAQQLMMPDNKEWYETPWGVGLGAGTQSFGAAFGESLGKAPGAAAGSAGIPGFGG
jgi:hypothetical protein